MFRNCFGLLLTALVVAASVDSCSAGVQIYTPSNTSVQPKNTTLLVAGVTSGGTGVTVTKIEYTLVAADGTVTMGEIGVTNFNWEGNNKYFTGALGAAAVQPGTFTVKATGSDGSTDTKTCTIQ